MEALQQGSIIMVIGMSTVFVFLVIMIFAMNICSKVIQIVNKYFPETVEEPTKKVQKLNNEAEIALAIACAITKRAKLKESK